MTTIRLDERGFTIDGEHRPLVSAQFEFFRNNPLHWERILRGIKDAGIDIVSTVIAWDFHELRRGEFDLTGRTNGARDLRRFLELCHDLELLVFARPGPYIDAGWETRGPARDVMHLDRMHPRFLERAPEWIEAVCEILVPAQVTRGGPVALLQVDNQNVYPWITLSEQQRIHGDSHLPYDAAHHEARLRRWLRQRYASVEEMNAALGTGFPSWDTVRTARFGEDPPGYAYASLESVTDEVVEFLVLCRDLYREAGIDVGLYANLFQFLGYVEWTEVAKEIGSVGMDMFLSNDLPDDQPLVAAWWYRLHAARFAFSWAADFQAGWFGLFESFGFQTPEFAEYMAMAAQASGLRGLNYYMFVERDDWSHSPMTATGAVRPERLEAYERVTRSFSGIPQVTEHLADVGLLWNPVDHDSTYLLRDRDWSTICRHNDVFDEIKEPPTWWATFTALMEADVDFRLWIPGVSPQPAPRILVNAGLALTREEHVRGILDAVGDGGHALVEVTPLPERDVRGVAHDEIASIAARIRAATDARGETVAGVAGAVGRLGARAYARAAHPRVWTSVHRAEDGSIVLGVWNSSAEPYDAGVRLDPALFSPGTEACAVHEPRIGATATRALADVLDFQAALAPRTARVFHINETGERDG